MKAKAPTWNESEGTYYDRIDAIPRTEVAPYLAMPLVFGISNREQGTRVIDAIQRSGLIGLCGVSLWKYQGEAQEGYYKGSVWPMYTGLVALASFKYGRMNLGGSLLKILMDLTYSSSDPGKINEYYSHECLERGQFMQGFSSSPMIGLVTEGMMGIEADAPRSQLTIRPWLPDWLQRVQINGLRIGDRKLDLVYQKNEEGHVFKIESISGRESLDLLAVVHMEENAAIRIPTGWESCYDLRGRGIAKRFSLHTGEKITEQF
jgi:glycogen debranching enzyme